MPLPFPFTIYGGSRENSYSLLGNEQKGFALDFIANDYTIINTSDTELLLLLLGNEWSGLSIDFTSDLYINRITTGAELLLGDGPSTQESKALAIDFTDDSYATRI